MKQPCRSDIQNFADEVFAVRRQRIANEYGEKRKQALVRVANTGNSGGYLPALIAVQAEFAREMILARSAADEEAFTLYGVPPNAESEVALNAIGREIVGGATSAIYGDMQLLSQRTRQPSDSGLHLCYLEMERVLQESVREGVLRLRRRRIAATREGAPMAPTSVPTPVAMSVPRAADQNGGAATRSAGDFPEGPAGMLANENAGDTVGRRAEVDAFLQVCTQEAFMNMTRKHIWRAADHKTGRQFQYFQAGSHKATDADRRNFQRILSMSPVQFLALLKKKGIISGAS